MQDVVYISDERNSRIFHLLFLQFLIRFCLFLVLPFNFVAIVW